MSTPSNWIAIPTEVLQRAFELQQNGLANCAAARSCIAWWDVARRSHVQDLHLHADTDIQEQFWHRLLAARPSVDTLKLERVIRCSDSYATQRSDSTATATINSIPTACRSLSLSEFAAYGLEQYTAKLPHVQQLSLQWNGVQAEKQSFHSLPSFAALRQLTELKISMRNDFLGASFAPLVKSCPSTVQSLVLDGFGCTVEQEQPPIFSVHDLNLLESHLPSLTHLELGHSVVTIPGDSITCLSKLKCLSFRQSDVYVDGELEVSLLTNLTHLNLTAATCFWEDAWVEALDTFTAWPALQVLKATHCNLFDKRTKMDLTTVLEVHVDHFDGVRELGSPGQQSYVHTDLSHFVPPEGNPLREDANGFKCIAGLALNVNTQNPSHNASALDPFLCQLAELCCIKSLDLVFGCSTLTRPLTFLGSSFAKLVNLSMVGLHPYGHALDLQPLSCLTSLDIDSMDQPEALQSIKLPCKLEVFKFTGFSLFLHSTEHNLDKLPCLIKLTLLPGPPDALSRYVNQGWRIPQLPLSLRHFLVEDLGDQFCRGDFDWSGLQGCQNLEHLTLASLELSEQLKEWLRSARYLYMIDHEINELDGLTNRLPVLDETSALWV